MLSTWPGATLPCAAVALAALARGRVAQRLLVPVAAPPSGCRWARALRQPIRAARAALPPQWSECRWVLTGARSGLPPSTCRSSATVCSACTHGRSRSAWRRRRRPAARCSTTASRVPARAGRGPGEPCSSCAHCRSKPAAASGLTRVAPMRRRRYRSTTRRRRRGGCRVRRPAPGASPAVGFDPTT